MKLLSIAAILPCALVVTSTVRADDAKPVPLQTGEIRTLPLRTEAPARTVPLVIPNVVVNEAQVERLAARPVALPSALTAKLRAELNAAATQLKRGNQSGARSQWEGVVQAYASGNDASGTDIHAMIQYVLREAYLEQVESQRDKAERVQYLNKQKKALHKHLAEMRKAARELSRRGVPPKIKLTVIASAPSPHRPGATEPQFRWDSRTMDKVALDAYITNLRKRLSNSEDEAQLANIDLQKTVQKQQQMMDIMSNIAKMMNDTAKSVIHNMK